MTTGPFLDTPARRRRRLAKERRRRARRRGLLVVTAVALLLGFGVFTGTTGDRGTRSQGGGADPSDAAAALPSTAGQASLGPLPAAVDLQDRQDPVRLRFKRPPRAALLFDVDTGEVLWRHRPRRTLPIASLTKMMTALVTVEALAPGDKARITDAVLAYSGSGVGVLPRDRRVRVETLLHGLMLPSGNDAARALAFRTAGSLRGFVRRMNERAGAMGLTCTRFASVEGLSERNRSCPADLAMLARAVLDEPRLARIVRRRRAILPFPIKGGRVHLWNNNPLLRARYPGTIGVKTGYTNEAGRCLVAAVRRRGVRLAAVVLHSEDPGRQAQQMLERGFRTLR